MLRRLLIAVLVLIVAAVIALDRVGAHVAAHVLAGKLESDEHLPERPSVSIGGFPFLTQAFGGDYRDVDMTAHGFKTPDGVTVTTLEAHLSGAHIPFSKVLHGSVSKVPVDHVDGTAYVSFTDVTHYLGRHGTDVTFTRSSSDSVAVTRKVPFGNRTGVVTGVGSVTIADDVISLQVSQISATVVGAKHRRAFSFPPFVLSVPLRSLPFRIDVKSVTVGAAGVTASGTANHVTLGS